MTDLKIYPVKNKNTIPYKIKHEIDERLPNLKANFVLGVIGKRHTGKTVLTTNLLLNPNFLNRENYNTAFCISPTIMNDKTAEHLREAFPATCYDKYDDSLIKDIVNYQKTFTDDEREKIIIVIDDMIGFKTPYLNHLTTRHRHYQVNIILISQAVKQVNKVARSNMSNVILFNTHNKAEFEDLYENFGSMIGSKKFFKKILDYATAEAYCFLYMKLDTFPVRFFKCFTEELTEKFKEEKEKFQEEEERELMSKEDVDVGGDELP
jgi:hypothetical protein